MFAWPLGAAPPGGPSKSTWIRGWIRGSTWRVKSSLPVWTSSAVALEEASNKATHAFLIDSFQVGECPLLVAEACIGPDHSERPVSGSFRFDLVQFGHQLECLLPLARPRVCLS